MSAITDRPLHLAHVATREDILLVRDAKAASEITRSTHASPVPDGNDLLGGRSEVRPRLGTQADVDALWANLDVIDCFATDHAPHTAAEKDGETPPPGFPGLETALPLFLNAVHAGRLTLADLIARMSTNPRHIFGIPEQPETWVDVDPDAVATLSNQNMHSGAAGRLRRDASPRPRPAGGAAR